MSEIVYTPGTWRGVVSPRGVAVLPSDVGPEVLDRVWRALDGGDGLGAVLESLAGAFGTGLSALPPFAVATFDGGGIRVAVRGDLEIEIDERRTDATGGAPVVVSGADVTTWSERVVQAADALVFRTPEQPGAEGFGIANGIVLCSTLTATLAAAATVEATRTPAATPPHPPRLVPNPADSAENAGNGTSGGGAEPASAPAAVVEPEAAASELTVVHDDGTSGGGEELHEEVESTRTELPDDAYDHLWGATVVKSVEDAAVRELDDEDEHDDAAPTTSPAPAAPAAAAQSPAAQNPTPAAPAPAPAPAPAVPPVASSGLIDSVPGFGTMGAASGSAGFSGVTVPPVRPPEPEPSAGFAPPTGAPALGSPPVAGSPASGTVSPAPGSARADDDHDGLTVTVSELEAMRRLADAAPAAELPAGALGRIVLSTGESYPLDRPVIIGRRPRANRVQADAVPILVAVASPEQDISRNHLEIRLEGRHVLAVDLATTNGSVLHRDGSPPKRLGPNEPELVLSGDVIDLGEGINVVFEEIP
ncbi:FHA domain-containing protein [Herbiconiux liangxiaofengii]|uniref:FHA domain-containing protein n=1 Tax=Herbiconiux liangxiaofengii TaxID=3342795 RepID=UPI0035BAB979